MLEDIIRDLLIEMLFFLLNHGGLWIILASGGLGSYDFEKVDMLVKLNNTVWYGYTSENDYVELPFAIELKKIRCKLFFHQSCVI